MAAKKKSAQVSELPTEERFVEIEAGTNKITVGSIPLEKLGFIRENYRKMNKRQQETLAASVDRFGFQSFVAVVKNADGSYAIVDGHHRVQELRDRGATSVPVILLPEGTQQDRKLGMLSFNVSAEVEDEKFAALVLELMADGADVEDIRKAATLSESFMEDLEKTLAMSGEEAPPAEDALDREGTASEPKAKKSKIPAIKVLVLLAPNEPGGAPTIQALMATHADTVISKDVRDTLEASGISIDEVPPTWVENEGHLLELLASADDEDGEDVAD